MVPVITAGGVGTSSSPTKTKSNNNRRTNRNKNNNNKKGGGNGNTGGKLSGSESGDETTNLTEPLIDFNSTTTTGEEETSSAFAFASKPVAVPPTSGTSTSIGSEESGMFINVSNNNNSKKAASTTPQSTIPQQHQLPASFQPYSDIPTLSSTSSSTRNNNTISGSNATIPTNSLSKSSIYGMKQSLLETSGSNNASANESIPMGTDHNNSHSSTNNTTEIIWLLICFIGIMASFVAYGLLLEYTTSGGRKLHELSFLFVTSGLYTITAAAGRYVRDETPTTIPPARFAILGLTSMGSTFCSVRSLRYVIFPIQVLAKSCKPVPVMLMGALMGKKYPLRKYFNVALIVGGVALFMGGGDQRKKGGGGGAEGASNTAQLFGLLLLFISLCFDGGTGAYEDKLMSVHSVQPFDLMFNIQLGKTILAGVGLLVLNQMHIFIQMIQDMGFLLVALGLTGALGQVFIFITIAKFGALTCSIIGLARKVTTLVASIWYFGHHINSIQFIGLAISVLSMVMDFFGKKKGGKGGGHGGGGGHDGGHGTNDNSTDTVPPLPPSDELKKILGNNSDDDDDDDDDIEFAAGGSNDAVAITTSNNRR